MHGRVHGRVLGHMHGPVVRDDGLDERAADIGFARLGLVVVHDLVGTGPRIGCTRAKLYGHDRAMWLVFRNVHMQLKKEEACN